jgi:RNA polymerase-binding transcription factor DksA
MKKKQLDHLEQRLLKERQRAVKAVRQLEDNTMPQDEDGDLTNYPFHLADEGTDTNEQEQSFLLRSQEGRLLYEIDDALRTLYKEPERYGRCYECDTEIAFERLDVVPWAKYCLEHQEKQEEQSTAA